MKCIILAGGYGKRMWPLTLDTPKALLPLNDSCILDYNLQKIKNLDEVDEVVISTNLRFEDKFKDWLSKFKFNKDIKLLIEPTKEETEKLGAIGSLHYIIKNINLQEDALVIASDNLIEFDLKEFLAFSAEKAASCVLLYDMKDKNKVALKYGVVELDRDNRILKLEEKPKHPKSTLIACACYLFKKHDINLIDLYIQEKNNKDYLGYLVDWLSKKSRIYGLEFSGAWFDIGSLQDYENAKIYYGKK